MKNVKQIYEFIKLIERLKCKLRNGKTSEYRQESVADHTWRLSMMVILLANSLKKNICVLKSVKMALIHDLAEVFTGDQPYFHHIDNPQKKALKRNSEEEAMQKIASLLPQELGEEIASLWVEYEENLTLEARFVKALDKIEAQIQHNQMDFIFWNSFDIKYADNLLDDYCKFDPMLDQLKKYVQSDSKKKILKNLKNKQKSLI